MRPPLLSRPERKRSEITHNGHRGVQNAGVLRLAPDASSAARARRFVESVLRSTDDPVVVGLEDTVTLLTSELVANAVLHAGGHIDVHVDVDRGVVRVRVSDRGPGLPARKPDESGATTGRGLVLVDRLARVWGVDRDGPRKTVWFEVAAG